MKNKSLLFFTQAAMIGALYIVLTLFTNLFGLASGPIQLRLSEALTILPYFTPAAIPGLFVGCIISNTLVGSTMIDIIFGSIATLIGAIFSYKLRKNKWLVSLPPIISNTIIIPIVLKTMYGAEDSIFYFALTVGIGQILSCGVVGMLLLFSLKKYQNQLFH